MGGLRYLLGQSALGGSFTLLAGVLLGAVSAISVLTVCCSRRFFNMEDCFTACADWIWSCLALWQSFVVSVTGFDGIVGIFAGFVGIRIAGSDGGVRGGSTWAIWGSSSISWSLSDSGSISGCFTVDFFIIVLPVLRDSESPSSGSVSAHAAARGSASALFRGLNRLITSSVGTRSVDHYPGCALRYRVS